MNLYTYEIFYIDRHQDLLAASAEARLVKLARENQANSNQNSSKFIDDVLQKVGQKFFGIYHHLYLRGKHINLEKMNS